jgi:phosphoribosylformylglycinamidine synthase
MIAGGLGNIARRRRTRSRFAPARCCPARRPGHAHRHGRRRGELDGGRRQRRRARLRFGAARQPGDPAPRAGGHQPLLGAGRGQPDPGDPRRRRRRLSNAFPELVDGGGAARASTCARCRSKRVRLAPKEIWCNESQERYVLAIAPERCRVRAMCERERCPFAVVGVARRAQLVARRRRRARAHRHADGRAARQAAEDARAMCASRARCPPLDLTGVALSEAAFDVLRHPPWPASAS